MTSRKPFFPGTTRQTHSCDPSAAVVTLAQDLSKLKPEKIRGEEVGTETRPSQEAIN